MITTPNELKKLCKTVQSANLLTPQNVSISHKIYRLFTKWQFRDKYPNLLGFRENGSYYMMRVG